MDTSEEEGVKYKGTKKYIIAIVFDNIEVHNVKGVPHDIDGLSVYTVPMLNTLENCRGYRNWGPAVSSKTVTFRDGPCLLMDCKGSHSCINLKCKNIPEFGINHTAFVKIEK